MKVSFSRLLVIPEVPHHSTLNLSHVFPDCAVLNGMEGMLHHFTQVTFPSVQISEGLLEIWSHSVRFTWPYAHLLVIGIYSSIWKNKTDLGSVLWMNHSPDCFLLCGRVEGVYTKRRSLSTSLVLQKEDLKALKHSHLFLWQSKAHRLYP